MSDKFIFEIEGKPIRKGFFKKIRSIVTFFDSRFRLEKEGEVSIFSVDEVRDVFVKEQSLGDCPDRVVVIELLHEGERVVLELPDGVFPGLSSKMEQMLEVHWPQIRKKRDGPQTVKWFMACCAVVFISSGQNPHIFGGLSKCPEAAEEARRVLRDECGLESGDDLLRLLPKLLGGLSIAEWAEKTRTDPDLDDYEESLVEEIKLAGCERCLWAFDLQRLIYLSAVGHVADFLSYEKALDWCLEAGAKLQIKHKNWDEFMKAYLMGFCYWAEEDPDDDRSESARRLKIYEFCKKLPGNPWLTPWDVPLKREWGTAD
ncbi:MAG: DUF1266 domain-containing protein [Deltaproteobacteria bacterium]|jgi:hypothetical protein|nr:DUF1266 domain-containing protein [Deltaproteobacteria bacterium]